MPANAGIQIPTARQQSAKDWIPACAGMTDKKVYFS